MILQAQLYWIWWKLGVDEKCIVLGPETGLLDVLERLLCAGRKMSAG